MKLTFEFNEEEIKTALFEHMDGNSDDSYDTSEATVKFETREGKLVAVIVFENHQF